MMRMLACLVAFLLCVAAMPLRALESPAPTAAATTASPEVAEFQKIEDAWSNAINERDQYGLDLVLSPLLVDVSASGDISTRDQKVADLLSSSDKVLHMEQRVIAVRMLGDVAVANGTYVLHHQTKDAPVDEKGVFTHVFQRSHGRWMCINAQRTTVRTESTGKSRTEHESHFHLSSILSPGKKKN
ncbi:MAG: nuclear transport factor 2 family protein [Terracidiphilus sp.]